MTLESWNDGTTRTTILDFVARDGALTNPNAEPILTTAERFGWTVASMRDDRSRIFV